MGAVGADGIVAAADRRATAASTAMVAITFGAVAGPNTVEATGKVATAAGCLRSPRQPTTV